MVENVWEKIWDRIKDNPERLKMSNYFTGDDGDYLDHGEISLHNCGTAQCIVGHAIAIALEEGVLNLPIPHPAHCIPYTLGESIDSEGEFNELGKIIYDSDDDEAYLYVKRRAGAQ